MKYIEKKASIVITISNTLKDFCTKQGIPNQKIQTIYDGIPLPDIKPAVSNKVSSSARIVCVGNFAPSKGQDVVIDALIKLPPELLKRISVDFYGEQYDIQFCKRLHNEIQKHHLDSNNHVNNGQYVKLALSELESGSDISHIRIDYRKQARFQDVIYPVVYETGSETVVALYDEERKPFSVSQFTKG